jgi:pre-mRNA-splicing factor ATP-dependent RNA helicase DHX16
LAAYDLGAPAKVLQAIYDTNIQPLRPIDIVEKNQLELVTEKNWTNFLRQEKSVSSVGIAELALTFLPARYYASFVAFFTSEIIAGGVGSILEKYVFSAAANGNGSNMLLRFVGGAYV